MINKTVTLKKNHDKRLWLGHHWIFSNELETVPKYDAGDIVEVFNSSGKSYGYGFFNPNSLISVRLLFTDQNIDTEFFQKRIEDAISYRKRLFPGSNVYRMVFGESDYLPGLIIDRYGDYLSIQALSAGIDKFMDEIVEALLIVLPEIPGIYEKNSSQLRVAEGLPLNEGVLYGVVPDNFIIEEEGIKLNISLSLGQKTGYFLDQRWNRKFIRSISKDMRVLDCYTNQGGFALNAALGGATKVSAIDVSQPALDQAAENAKSNNFNSIEYIKADVSEFLLNEIESGNSWDMIILDPPAFAKSRKKVPVAKAGYAKINRLAMKLITKHGILVSSSCSQQIEEDVFFDIIHREASKLNRQLRLIFRGLQSPCHPILAAMSETKYLKFFVFEVL